MSTASLHAAAEGRLELSGTLDFDTVPRLVEEGAAYLTPDAQLVIDLGGVVHTNSAGLAMLVAWLRRARQQGAQLRFAHLPAQMRAAAELTGVIGILPVIEADGEAPEGRDRL